MNLSSRSVGQNRARARQSASDSSFRDPQPMCYVPLAQPRKGVQKQYLPLTRPQSFQCPAQIDQGHPIILRCVFPHFRLRFFEIHMRSSTGTLPAPVQVQVAQDGKQPAASVRPREKLMPFSHCAQCAVLDEVVCLPRVSNQRKRIAPQSGNFPNYCFAKLFTAFMISIGEWFLIFFRTGHGLTLCAIWQLVSGIR